jgi:alpha-D-xyloside xylohydrolase
MNTRRIVVSAVLISGCSILGCGPRTVKVGPIENGVRIEAAGESLAIRFLAPGIVRIVKWPAGGTSENPSPAVILKPSGALDVQVTQQDGFVLVRTPQLSVRASKQDGRVEFIDAAGTSLLKEGGTARFERAVFDHDTAFHARQPFAFEPDEGLYGLGQLQDGAVNRRGRTIVLVQSNTEAVIPFLVSTRGYGILWDNLSKTVFDDTGAGSSFLSDAADNVDYYFIRGGSMDAAVAGYRELTGRAPMYGRWAYGYWQSREHYHTRGDLMAVAEGYRSRKIPIDNIIQDWDYWNGAPNWGGLFFDRTLFPDPKGMVDALHRMHYHMMISIWPALGPATPIYREMAAKGFLYPPVGWAGFKYYDAFNPKANDLYWRALKNGLASKGIDAWWIDSTEPDVVNALTMESSEYELKKMGRNHLGSWARTLNGYSLAMTDALYGHLRSDNGGRRPYILTRSAFAGQQRNAATTWSGDIGASWEVYKNQIAAGLGHSMAGIPYWTFDIGAFVLGAYGGVFHRGGKDPAYQELYARMFQFGAFCPIFRSHGSETPREIWEMGEFADMLVRYDRLRYRLLPYLYSEAWRVTSEGYTLMRGLPMDFPDDPAVRDIGDQYLFGPAFLVCPVTEYQVHRPPEPSVPVGSEVFRTEDGKHGLWARYFKDPECKILGIEQVDPGVNVYWYTGRPSFVTDSAYAIRWTGKLVPPETGPYQFHLKCFDAKRIRLDGKELRFVYTSTEQYTEPVDLVAGREVSFACETENRSTGAARVQLFWKTPSIFAEERKSEKRPTTRPVVLPAGADWIDFWTGETCAGGKTIDADAPIDKIPLYVRAGSIVPMGPPVEWAEEKPADPIELRVYPGADGAFTLYEDENDGSAYERGVFATIDFLWKDAEKTLVISDRKGGFPGMLSKRTFRIVLVGKDHGVGFDDDENPDRVAAYRGVRQEIQFKYFQPERSEKGG